MYDEIAAIVVKQIADMRRELEENAKDAERYRWLRDSGATVSRTMRPGEDREHVEVDTTTSWTRRATLDAAIDVAMRGKP